MTGAKVTIVVWRPPTQHDVAQFEGDLVEGLENPLIAWAQPARNIAGRQERRRGKPVGRGRDQPGMRAEEKA